MKPCIKKERPLLIYCGVTTCMPPTPPFWWNWCIQAREWKGRSLFKGLNLGSISNFDIFTKIWFALFNLNPSLLSKVCSYSVWILSHYLPLLVVYTKKIQPYPLGPEDATGRSLGMRAWFLLWKWESWSLVPMHQLPSTWTSLPWGQPTGPVSMLGEDEDANISLRGSQIA